MKLKPLPISRNEETHTYFWEPTGEKLSYSTTQIIGINKTQKQIEAIEKTKDIWAPRGKHVHLCLEKYLTGEVIPDPGDYEEWIVPLLEHDFWQEFEPWAVEYMLCDLKKSVGGQLDVLGYDHKNKELVLLDLKTQGSARASRYNTDAQLGSYLHALIDHHKLNVEACRTIWARPGKTILGPNQNIDECGIAWLNAWEKFVAINEMTNAINEASIL
tara:strand:+ start:703 stop:1350 length:648 start_codon:yes stop_codon:yes gene_type:complete